MKLDGALPFSTQSTSAVNSCPLAGKGIEFAVFAGPRIPLTDPIPLQWPMPGIKNSRLNACTAAAPPIAFATRVK